MNRGFSSHFSSFSSVCLRRLRPRSSSLYSTTRQVEALNGWCLCCSAPSFLCSSSKHNNFSRSRGGAVTKSRVVRNSGGSIESIRSAGLSTHSTVSSYLSDPEVKPSPHVENLIANNKKWIEGKKGKEPGYFDELKKPQRPKYIYFGCADSRVSVTEILGLGPGEVFVHRNVGNIIHGNDLSALSVLEYGVDYLGATDIIVSGHYDCGAVRAAASRQDLGTLEHWLRAIRDVYRLHKDYLDSIPNDEDRHQSLVELNVIEQCLNLYKTAVVQRKRIQTRDKLATSSECNSFHDSISPRIHPMVFNPADGCMRPLRVDLKKRFQEIDNVYGLYNNTVL